MNSENKKHIAILGSTGSIGTQTLEVIAANLHLFKVEVLTAHSNAELLASQAIQFDVNAVVITDESKYAWLKEKLAHTDIKVFAGEQALSEVVTFEKIQLVLTALVGYAGLKPTIAAIKAKKNIALANKETLVVAGDLITKLAEEHDVSILPVDSEHSAIFQCLAGEWHNKIEKIYLTASGGPFRGMDRLALASKTKAQALKHPNWTMGAKITIDSASLMNKGLEVIEAKWLFNLQAAQIDVIVHPQSIIHSIVQFEDGSMKAQMGLPDMKLPIQYALTYPMRTITDFPRFDFLNYPTLSFEKVDTETFQNLALAFQAMKQGGNMPCILNAANEVVVEAFLNDQIGFLEMSDAITDCMQKITFIDTPNYDDYVATDTESRIFTRNWILNK
jgi:1-deoxy-D-xylulose-5-phosphate reductoisomerase